MDNLSLARAKHLALLASQNSIFGGFIDRIYLDMVGRIYILGMVTMGAIFASTH